MIKKAIAIFLILSFAITAMSINASATVATKSLNTVIDTETDTIEIPTLTLKEQVSEIITNSLNSKKNETTNWLNNNLGRKEKSALDNNVSHIFAPEAITVFAHNLIVQIKRTGIIENDEIIDLVESLSSELFTLTINTTSSKAPYLIRYSGDLALKERFPDVDFGETITSEYSLNERDNGIYSELKSKSLVNLTEIKLFKPLEDDIVTNLTSNFGVRSVVNKVYDKNHRGIDVAQAKGTKIFAADDGKVIYSTHSDNGYGNYIVIEHDGYYTLYAHASELLVKMNKEVKKGDVIAKVGSTGNSTGNHLHFEIIVDGESINPLYYL